MGCPANGKRGFGVLNERGLNLVPLVGPPTMITATTSSSSTELSIPRNPRKVANFVLLTLNPNYQTALYCRNDDKSTQKKRKKEL
uniref:Uncharacterized protein n=2 Tax=Rhizophora mucronata TaxID=61149 RepID=A0A2P2KZF3_RHIMU